MNGREKSDSAEVAVKPANKTGMPAAEQVEPRAGTEGNAIPQSTSRTQGRADASQARDRIRVAARRNKKEKFTALLHHVTPEALRDAFYAIAKNAAAGIDGITWRDYEADLERKLADLHDRVQSGAYRATPSRRIYIPKPDGGQRPLAVAALEDKIVQRAVVDVLNAIYEGDFLGFSYGFRPGRGAHDALDALSAAIYARKVNYIVDADIAEFFDSVSKEWLAHARGARADFGASRESTHPRLQRLHLLPIAASDDAVLCLEGRRFPHLGIGPSLRCGGCRRKSCNVAAPQGLLASEGAVERGRRLAVVAMQIFGPLRRPFAVVKT